MSRTLRGIILQTLRGLRVSLGFMWVVLIETRKPGSGIPVRCSIPDWQGIELAQNSSSSAFLGSGGMKSYRHARVRRDGIPMHPAPAEETK